MKPQIVLHAPHRPEHTVNGDLVWTPTRKLAWTDFQKKQDESCTATQNEIDAQSVCKITTRIQRGTTDNTFTVTVNTIFCRNQSWVALNKKSFALLAHEQGHFDLMEVYTRKIRMALATEKLTTREAKLVLSVVGQKYWNEQRVRQQLYDNATNHGRQSEEQAKWSQTIEAELIKLRNFSF